MQPHMEIPEVAEERSVGRLSLVTKPAKKQKVYGRVNASGSKLARPKSPIYTMAAEFQNHLHMPDPLALYATAGALAANMLDGYPVWLMIVGSSGSGKSALIRSFEKLDGVVNIGSLSGEAAFLSGTKAKEREEGSTGGLLRELGDKGAFLFSEFGDVLEMAREPMKRVLAVMRQIYDGAWSRRIGEGGGRTLDWSGRAGLVGGVTNAIDAHAADMAAMGERLLYFRLNTGGYGEAMSTLRTSDPAGRLASRQAAVGTLYDEKNLHLHYPTERRDLHLGEIDRLIALGTFTSKARSSVPRDSYNKEIMNVASFESPTRLTGALGQLLLGMEAIGLDEDDRWRVLSQVCVDSMPLLRKRVLEAVFGGARHVPAVQKYVQVSESTVRRTLEELEILGLVVKSERGGELAVVEWARERLVLETN